MKSRHHRTSPALLYSSHIYALADLRVDTDMLKSRYQYTGRTESNLALHPSARPPHGIGQYPKVFSAICTTLLHLAQHVSLNAVLTTPWSNLDATMQEFAFCRGSVWRSLSDAYTSLGLHCRPAENIVRGEFCCLRGMEFVGNP